MQPFSSSTSSRNSRLPRNQLESVSVEGEAYQTGLECAPIVGRRFERDHFSPAPISAQASTNQPVGNSLELGGHPIVDEVLPTDLPVRFVGAVRTRLKIGRAFGDGAQAILDGGILISRDRTTRALLRTIQWVGVPVIAVECRIKYDSATEDRIHPHDALVHLLVP